MTIAQTLIAYSVQSPSQASNVLRAYQQLLKGVSYGRLTGLYAFATLKGARLLVDVLKKSVSWKKSKKRWIVSIDDGITEPDALRFLLSFPKSEVRIPYGEQLLTRALTPIFRFHPKTLLLESGTARSLPVGILVGSANLTSSGLCFGHEHVLSMRLPTSGKLMPCIADAIVEIEKMMETASVIDNSFIDRYEAIRPRIPASKELQDEKKSNLIFQDKPVIRPEISAAFATAVHLWIDIKYVVPNRGPGQEGNQIDMQRGSRVFFGFGDGAVPRNTAIGAIPIVFGGNTTIRNLRFGNNFMDKLDLPVPGFDGPPTYAAKTLLFTKAPGNTFRLTLGSKQEVADWKKVSRERGTFYSMRSGRQFGVF